MKGSTMSSGACHQTSQQEASLAVGLGVLVFDNGMESTLSKLMPMINVEVQASMIAGRQRIDRKHMSSSNYNSQLAVKNVEESMEEKNLKSKMVLFTRKVYSSQSFY